VNKKILLIVLLVSVILFVSSCDDSTKGRQINTGDKFTGTLADDQPSSTLCTTGLHDQGECVTECPEERPINEFGICVESCPYDFRDVKSDGGLFGSGILSLSIPEDKLVIDGNKCVWLTECPKDTIRLYTHLDGSPVLDGEYIYRDEYSIYCVESCPAEEPYAQNYKYFKSCVTSCPEHQPYADENNNCVAKKPTSNLPAICTQTKCSSDQVVCELDDGRQVCSADEFDCNNGNKAHGGNYGIGGSVISDC
jgi:hypothetical protein